MTKKLALVVISLDECFTQAGFKGGGHKVSKHIILGLVSSGLFEIDIFCQKSAVPSIDGVNSIRVLNKKTFVKDLESELKKKKYDVILSSDILLPFGNLILHSNSAKHKTKNGKNEFMQQILKIYNFSKIQKQEHIFKQNDKNIFTVSQDLKQDYSQNYNIPEDRIFSAHPAVDEIGEFSPPAQKAQFVLGGFAGGGLNKGGYLLLFALHRLKNSGLQDFRANIIFPKMHKASLYKSLIKILGLEDKIELLPKQSNMGEFYKSVDCYVLPSLNEAFGLMAIEAAAKSRPSLISSTTGVSELFSDFENGFLFNRAKNPLKNLTEGLTKVYNLYFSNYPKYVDISKKAWEKSKELDWQKFVDTIITNLREES